MKWFNFETQFRSLRDALTAFLHDNDIYHEISATSPFCGWYFAIECTSDQAQMINEWLDANTIYCKGVIAK